MSGCVASKELELISDVMSAPRVASGDARVNGKRQSGGLYSLYARTQDSECERPSVRSYGKESRLAHSKSNTEALAGISERLFHVSQRARTMIIVILCPVDRLCTAAYLIYALAGSFPATASWPLSTQTLVTLSPVF